MMISSLKCLTLEIIIGIPFLPEFGDDIDVRTDIPRYRVFKDGKLEEQTTNISMQIHLR